MSYKVMSYLALIGKPEANVDASASGGVVTELSTLAGVHLCDSSIL
jgi:hypothetical protein